MNKTISLLVSRSKKRFLSTFSYQPSHLVVSSGRMELIGNHTDHQGGPVLVAAIDAHMVGVVSLRNDSIVRIDSEGFSLLELDLNHLEKNTLENGTSKSIVKGMAYFLKEDGYLINGFDLALVSEVPPGAGVSSSAAFELLIGKIFSGLFNKDKIENSLLAIIGQKAENQYFGKPSGLLDQMGVALGGVNFIDFNNFKQPLFEHYQWPFLDLDLFLVDTGGSHDSLTSHYSQIKDDMASISKYFGHERLIDVTVEQRKQVGPLLLEKFPQRSINRALHFFKESQNVYLGQIAIKKKDTDGFLKMINASGRSSEMFLENITYLGDQDQKLFKGLEYVKSIIGDGAVRVHGGGFAGTILVISKKVSSPALYKELISHFSLKSVHQVTIVEHNLFLEKI